MYHGTLQISMHDRGAGRTPTAVSTNNTNGVKQRYRTPNVKG
jgi:hypothetical protein